VRHAQDGWRGVNPKPDDAAGRQPDLTFPMPASTIRALDELAAGTRVPAEPRDASSVILLRQPLGDAPVEAFLLVRQRSMSFAAGMAAFAGGAVDPSDSGVELGLLESQLAEWATALRVDVQTVGRILSAAIRETFEETGVLLADHDGKPVDASSQDWLRRRQALEAHELAWDVLVRESGIRLRTESLRLWSCWVTPIPEPRRYRTWFFLASVPYEQIVSVESTEAFRAEWLAPSAALELFSRNELLLMPPQQVILRDLADGLGQAGLAQLQSRPHDPQRVEPVVKVGPEGAYLELMTSTI
jgi:8-oxo-dGTP pyrophosphatase MutT (NUDIX family)